MRHLAVSLLILTAIAVDVVAETPPTISFAGRMYIEPTNEEPRAIFSPDGRYLVTNLHRYDVTIYRTATFDSVFSLSGHEQRVVALAVSPDGTLLASADRVGVVRVWDFARKRTEFVLTGHTGRIDGLCFTSDGNYVISAGADGTARVWNALTGAMADQISLGLAATSMDIDGEGTRVAIGLENGSIYVFQIDGGELTYSKSLSRRLPSGLVNDVAWGPNSQLAATGVVATSTEWVTVGVAAVWDSGSPTARWTHYISWDLKSVSFSPTGDTVFVAIPRDTVGVFRTSDGQRIDSIVRQSWLPEFLATSPDGKYLVGGGTRRIRLWSLHDLTHLTTIGEVAGGITGLAFTPDSKHIVTSMWEPYDVVRVWRVDDRALVKRYHADDWRGVGVGITPDGEHIVTAVDSVVRMRRLADGVVIRTMLADRTQGFGNHIRRFALSPDGCRAVAVTYDSTLHVWDTSTGELVFRHELDSRQYELTVSPDSRSLAMAVHGEPALQVNLADGDRGPEIDTWQHPYAGPPGYSHDGSIIAREVSSYDIGFWYRQGNDRGYLSKWEYRHSTDRDGSSAIFSLAFTADDLYVIGVGEQMMRMWRVNDGEHMWRQKTVEGASSHTHGAISPDGRYVAAAGRIGGSRFPYLDLWDFGSPPVAVAEREPSAFALAQNAPNPFNPSTTLRFAVPSDGAVQMAVYDVTGRHVRTLVDRHVEAGEHSVVWDGRDDAGRSAASGVYIVRLALSGESRSDSQTNSNAVRVRRATLIR